MTATHRSRTGTYPEEGIKAPCVVSASSNLVLADEQTVGGVACVTDDRVLARSQTDTTENGIWIVDSGSWTRAPDWSDARDVAKGVIVIDAHNSALYLTSFTGECTAGVTSVTFSPIVGGGAGIVSVHRSEHILAQTDDTSGVHNYDFENTHVYLNGRLLPTSDYVENENGTVTLNEPVELSDGADLIIVTHNTV